MPITISTTLLMSITIRCIVMIRIVQIYSPANNDKDKMIMKKQ